MSFPAVGQSDRKVLLALQGLVLGLPLFLGGRQPWALAAAAAVVLVLLAVTIRERRRRGTAPYPPGIAVLVVLVGLALATTVPLTPAVLRLLAPARARIGPLRQPEPLCRLARDGGPRRPGLRRRADRARLRPSSPGRGCGTGEGHATAAGMALGADHPSAASLGAAARLHGRAADGGCLRRERLAGWHGGAAPRPLGHERRDRPRPAARERAGACQALARS